MFLNNNSSTKNSFHCISMFVTFESPNLSDQRDGSAVDTGLSLVPFPTPVGLPSWNIAGLASRPDSQTGKMFWGPEAPNIRVKAERAPSTSFLLPKGSSASWFHTPTPHAPWRMVRAGLRGIFLGLQNTQNHKHQGWSGYFHLRGFSKAVLVKALLLMLPGKWRPDLSSGAERGPRVGHRSGVLWLTQYNLEPLQCIVCRTLLWSS